MKKLYGVDMYMLEIQSEEIIRETKMYYYVEGMLGFYRYRSRVLKEIANLSPQDAINSALQEKEEELQRSKQNAWNIRSDIRKIKKLSQSNLGNLSVNLMRGDEDDEGID